MNDIAVSSVRSRVYEVATDQPEADGTLKWSSTTVVVAEVRAGGATGLGWTYGARGCQPIISDTLGEVIKGLDVRDIPAAHEAMVRSIRNQGRPGVVSSAISAVDIALWDCKARLLGVSLVSLIGRCRASAPIYGSGGFTTYSDATTAAQLERWVVEEAIPRVKIKIGESWGANPERDLARCALARRVIGEDAELFVDANGGYTRKQAVRIGHRLFDEFGVTWFEEPVSSDDLVGLRAIRKQLSIDVTAGEYGYDETYFTKMVDAGAVDCLQPVASRQILREA
jgi:L-alanine-DL-glutamate epimerase-like enolase superfamily enzyme